MMAAGAIPGAYLISRLGARRAVVAGLALVTIGAGLRGVFPSALSLFIFTVVLALGIAVTQPAMPSLAQAWFPSRIGRAIATYSNGLLVGEVIAASLTLPLLLVPFGWPLALSAWALPAGIVLALWLAITPPDPGTAPVSPAWLPDLASGRVLRIGLLMGGASLVYFGMNTWIPDTLDARHAHQLIPLTLGLLNLMQIPVSLWLAWRGDTMLGRRWPYALAGIGSVVGVAGYALAPVATAPLWAGLADRTQGGRHRRRRTPGGTAGRLRRRRPDNQAVGPGQRQGHGKLAGPGRSRQQPGLHPQPRSASVAITVRSGAHQRLHVHGRIRRRLLRSRAWRRDLGLDRLFSFRAGPDAGRVRGDAGVRPDVAGAFGQRPRRTGGVRSRVVIASSPASTSDRSMASWPARSARAIAITCALNVA